MSLSTDIANSVCKKFETDGTVFPPNMTEGVFTAGVVDNIDYNPSSSTSKDSFHGTSISLIQNKGCAAPLTVIDATVKGKTHIMQLPLSYTDIDPVPQTKREEPIPPCQESIEPAFFELAPEHPKEQEWLEHCYGIVQSDQEKVDAMSWSAFHAERQPDQLESAANIGLLPLLVENAHSIAMIKHAMNVVMTAILKLNPEQTPVIAMDQPLYALAKEIHIR